MSAMTNPIRIQSIRYAGGHTIAVRWLGRDDRHTIDLSKFVAGVKGLRALRDETKVAKASLGEDGFSVVWPGELDIGADRLFELALEQNGRSDTVEFLRWRWRHALSLSDVAAALGLSRRMVAYYASGTREVPRTILLACKGWEMEKMENARKAA